MNKSTDDVAYVAYRWLELGLVDGLLSAKAWPDDDPVPTEPQFTWFDSNPHAIADISVAGWISTGWRSPVHVDASFDDISFRPYLECDFDGDGTLGVGDIHLLLAQISSGDGTARFDINNDQSVDAADIVLFVTSEDKLNTWIGDANLDGEFNSEDFVPVFQAGLFETGRPAQWEHGDWNGDGRFDSGDFVAAFRDGGYEQGVRTKPVPEPKNISVVLAFAVLAIFQLRSSIRPEILA
ncbi:MAG: hypothetical protein KDA87_22785 [Planctomycetales bacterium]|nr:hypothetical protein [Planctomycetales bacterium]